MKKRHLLGIIVIICGLIAIPLYLSMTVPVKVERILVQGLHEAGFENVKKGRARHNAGSVVLKNIALGEGGFSTIGEISADYGWIGILFRHRIKNLALKNLNMTGELNEDGSITLAGWQQPKGLNKTSLTHTDTITIDKANIDLLSPSLGGINLKINGQIRRKAKGGLSLQGRIEGAQKQLSLGAKLTGDITSHGNWQTNIEIEQGKMNFGPVRAGRISGLSQIYGEGLTLKKMTTQLAAGAMTVYGLPWQNASATIEGIPGDMKVFIEGKSIGEEGIELGANFDYISGIQNLEGIIHTQKLSELFEYLQKHNVISTDDNPPALLKDIPNLSFSFSQELSGENPEIKNFAYELRDSAGIVDLKGKLTVDSGNRSAEGTLAASPILLERFTALEEEEKLQNGFNGGVISVSGEFKSALEENDSKTTGKINARLEDARYHIGPYGFEKINGDVAFKNLESWALATPANLSFQLPLRGNIIHEGTAPLKVESKQFIISRPEVKIFAGTVKSNSINLSKTLENQDLALLIDTIDMGQAALALDIERLHTTGFLSGNLPLEYRDGTLYIKNGQLTSHNGTIRYRPETPPPFLKNDDMYTETMRLALENYRFSELNITLDGPVNGDIKLVITADGANPELFDGRPVALNFNLVTSLPEIFKKVLK